MPKPLAPCPECGALPGQLHLKSCHIEACPECGRQLLSCGCRQPKGKDRIPWAGEWPGEAECREFGWFAKLIPGKGWVSCQALDARASPDLWRLYRDAEWDRTARRFRRKLLSTYYLSDDAINAPLLNPSQVEAKLKKGWVWYRLKAGLGSEWGTVSYSLALISPEGEIAFVRTSVEGPEDLSDLPVAAINYRLTRLAVPDSCGLEAKAWGAVWVEHRNTWACAPNVAHYFEDWIDSPAEEFDLIDDIPQKPTKGNDHQ